MLETAGALGAGWYRDPADRRGARFHDGKDWTGSTQPGAGRLMASHPPANRPRASLTRAELTRRHHASQWSYLGQYVDVYL